MGKFRWRSGDGRTAGVCGHPFCCAVGFDLSVLLREVALMWPEEHESDFRAMCVVLLAAIATHGAAFAVGGFVVWLCMR